MALSLLVGLQLARGLGLEGYGVYGLAMSIIAVLALPAEFGMPQLLVREVAAAHASAKFGRIRGVVRWATRAAWLVSAAIIAAIGFWLLLFDRELNAALTLPLLIGAVSIPAVVLVRQRGAILQGLHHVVGGQLPDGVIRPAVFSLLLLITYVAGWPLNPTTAMAMGFISVGCALIVTIFMIRSAMPSEVLDVQPESDSRKWWASALPMAMTEGMRGLQGNIAILILGLLASTAEVGVFRVATSVSIVVGLPIAIFIIVGSPTISKLYTQGDTSRLDRLLGWLAGGMTLGSVLLMLPIVVSGEWLLGAAFGADYSVANVPLMVLCLGGVVYSALGPSFIVLNMTGHEKRVTRALGYSVAALLVLAPPLAFYYGSVGAAVSSSFAFVLSNWLMWKDTRDLTGMDASVLNLIRKLFFLRGHSRE
jgi:O-antigen/teichoic acid export membrane protein